MCPNILVRVQNPAPPNVVLRNKIQVDAPAHSGSKLIKEEKKKKLYIAKENIKKVTE